MLLPDGALARLPLARDGIDQNHLNILDKRRSNPLPWNGQFSPQLVEVLLHQYGIAGGTVLDPFVGSGTVLLESALAQMDSVGAEINPAAVLLSALYSFINVSRDERMTVLRSTQASLARTLPEHLPFGSTGPAFGGDLHETTKALLVRLWHNQRDNESKALLGGLITLADFHVTALTPQRVWQAWRKISEFVQALPNSDCDIRVLHTDSRDLGLGRATVDTVITSPPYINVFNYHQRYRASMEAINWDLLRVAHSEIGSNRKHRGNRFLTVIQYCLDMAMVFRELARVCKADARVVFIIGRESSVRKTRVFNGEIVSEVACSACGFELERRQERAFNNKFGATIWEDVLLFGVPNVAVSESESLVTARGVAMRVLNALLDVAPRDERIGVEDALMSLELVKPSPIFHPNRRQKPSDALLESVS